MDCFICFSLERTFGLYEYPTNQIVIWLVTKPALLISHQDIGLSFTQLVAQPKTLPMKNPYDYLRGRRFFHNCLIQVIITQISEQI